MPKLPKQKTMIDTINRVRGYTTKLVHAQKISNKQWLDVQKALDILHRAIRK